MEGLEPIGEKRRRYAKQLGLCLATCVGHIAVGMSMAFPNVFTSDQTQGNNTLFGTQLPISDQLMDMIGSTYFMGSIPGFLIAGWVVSSVGRRWSLLISCLPGILGSLLVALATNSYMLIIGRCLDGMSFGILQVAVRTYLTEVTDTKIRGGASASVNLQMQTGSICMVSLGILTSWYYLSFVITGILIVFCVTIIPFVPKSPTLLAIKNKDEQAKIVLRSLRGKFTDIDKELQLLKDMNTRVDGTTGWKTLFQPDILKKLAVLVGLFLIHNFCGVQVIRSNATRMLKSSGSPLKTEINTILVISVLFFGNIFMMMILDRIGRRWCLIISLATLVIAYGSLGSFVFLQEWMTSQPPTDIAPIWILSNSTMRQSDVSSNTWNWNFIPVTCLMLAAFGQSIGIGPIPWILTSEYFPTNIRSQATSLCSVICGLQSVASLQLFSPMETYLTPAGFFWTYSAVAAVGIPYTLALVQETKNKSVG